MKHYISGEDWAALESLLMRAEIPYYVSFDSHVHEDMEHATYDKYIRIEPIIIQKEVKVV
jgi:hypothetical protein